MVLLVCVVVLVFLVRFLYLRFDLVVMMDMIFFERGCVKLLL